MDGYPMGWDNSGVEATARGLGIPWEEGTLQELSLLQEIFLKTYRQKLDKNRKK